MRNIGRRVPELTRQRLVDPLLDVTYWDRLRRVAATDLRDNLRVEHVGDGYARALPIDPSRRWGPDNS